MSDSFLIHRFWIGDHPHPHSEWTAKALTVFHPEASIMEWDVSSAQDQLDLTLDAFDDPRHLSNIVRYTALWMFGGLWVDHDVIPLARLDHPSPYSAAVHGQREGAVLWFPSPAHPMLSELIQSVSKWQYRSAPSHIRSGATMLSNIGSWYPEVALRDIFAVDSDGEPASKHPLVYHLWDTSGFRLRRR